jgi:hypothetical protein
MNEPLKKHLCVCGHEETYHKEGDGYCFGFSCRNGVGCISFRPAPSQPSMEVSECCGAEWRIRQDFDDNYHAECLKCEQGCKLAAQKKEKESTEVRDEKIARIVKEFREKFPIELYYGTDTEGYGAFAPKAGQQKEMIDWLTQTLTTLLNEE